MGIRACLAVIHLGCWLLAQAEPTEGAALPRDLREALLAMPRQESPDRGLVVSVIDGETKAALPNASVFLMDQVKLQAVASRLQRGGTDLERDMLVMPYLAGRRYQTGADGKVIVPPLADAGVYAVTTAGFGFGMPARGKAAAMGDALEVRVYAYQDYVVRAVNNQGQPVVGVPIELGPYGENGMDRFEPIGAALSDADGRVSLRLPGVMVQAFSGRKRTLSAQVSVVGGPPVRKAMQEVGQDGVLELVLPPLGKVIVRLYDAQEHPRAGLKSVELRAVDETPRNRLPSALPAADRPQKLTTDTAHFDFVVLGKELVAHVAGDGLSDKLEHRQSGPLRAGELVVLAVRVVDSSPVLSLRLLGVDGVPVATGPVAVRFEAGGSVMRLQEVATGDDGRVLVALPEKVVDVGGRVILCRRHEKLLADTIYGGTAVVEVPAAQSGLREVGDVRLVEEPVAVAGRLVDSDGKPLAGCVVRMNPTHASDPGDGVSLRPSDVPHGPLLHHQATTDAEGRFTFRELEPAARTGPIEIADGAWLLPVGTRLTTRGSEQRLVAMRPGRVELSFAKQTPHPPRFKVSTASGAVMLHAKAEKTIGNRLLLQLPPGRHDLELLVGGLKPLRIDGIEVRAGETCADPRLVDIDWTQGLRILTVRLHRADGSRGGWLQWQCLGAGDRSLTSGSSIEDGGTLVLPEGTQRIAFGSDRYRTVVKPAAGDTVDVDMVPRRRIRLSLAPGLEVP